MFEKRVGNRAHPPGNSDEAQARASLGWLERDLKPYLVQLRALADAR
jgi:hypothetical protein